MHFYLRVNDAAPMAEEGTENHVEDDGMMIEDDTEEIDKIQALGINAGDVNKLKAAGVRLVCPDPCVTCRHTRLRRAE